jgi:poly(3-hydroxyalkanoate) synthetase
MDDYVNGRATEVHQQLCFLITINNCNYICSDHNIKNLNIMSVCQGGTLSTIYSSIYPHKVKNLITLVTPIDFSVNDGLLFPLE